MLGRVVGTEAYIWAGQGWLESHEEKEYLKGHALTNTNILREEAERIRNMEHFVHSPSFIDLHSAGNIAGEQLEVAVLVTSFWHLAHP